MSYSKMAEQVLNMIPKGGKLSGTNGLDTGKNSMDLIVHQFCIILLN